MPVIIDDSFYDDLGDGLPPRSLSFLLPAASWSARRSKSGFVPSWVVAKLSDDPDRDMGPLQAAGIARRVKGGGMQIAEGKGITIVNADEAAAEAERKREQGRLRAQRKRDRDKAARTAAMADGVTQASRGQEPGVTQTERAEEVKPQVIGPRVTRYESRSSRVTAKIDASDDQDLSIGVGQVDACAREAPPPAVVALVAAECSGHLGRPVTEAEACRAIDVWDQRAEASGKAVHDPAKFYPACAAREHKLRKLEAILAAPDPVPPPKWLELGQAPEPPAGAHVFMPSGIAFDGSCMHPGCVVPKGNRIHLQEANTG